MNDRKSPVFWQTEAREYYKQNSRVLAQYQEFCRQFRGDMSGIPMADVEGPEVAFSPGYANLTQLQARIMRADLMFRTPKPQVSAPSSDRVGFTPRLASIETKLLQDFVMESDYYRELRRAGLDYVLGASAIAKLNVGDSSELDLKEMKKQREAALMEDNTFVASGGRIKPRLRKNDRHVTHIEEHSRFLASAERGEIQLPEEAKEILRDHIDAHTKAIRYDRQTESSRHERVSIRRIHPENFSCDPWAERPYAREWYKERFIARVADAQDNPNFSRKAVEAIEPCTERRPAEPGRVAASRAIKESIQTQDEHFLCHEVVDMVEGRVILFADGATTPLLVRPWTLASVIPSGPYEEASLIEDPDECWGVPAPLIAEAHQRADSELFEVMTTAAQRSLPMNFVNGMALDKSQRDRIKDGDIAELIVCENVRAGEKMEDYLAQVLPAEVPRQNFVIQMAHREMRQKLLGLGSARVGGGDDSKTATASVITSASVNSLAEDSAGGWDDFQSRILRKATRYIRCAYSQRQVYEIVGQDALEPDGWPVEGFSDRDVMNDRNVSIVPGSSRRNDSDIKTKMLAEIIGLFQTSPLAPMMPEQLTALYERLCDSAGQYGLNWDTALRKMLEEQAMQMVSQAAGINTDPEAEAGEKEPAGKPKPRRSESNEPSAANQNGAARNLGGGRVATGAGAGDNMRLMR